MVVIRPLLDELILENLISLLSEVKEKVKNIKFSHGVLILNAQNVRINIADEG